MASEKVVYEQLRRKRNADERKVYQVLYPWLQIKHPEVFAEFNDFFEQLKQKYPYTKNLSTTEDFKRFCQRKKVCIFLYFLHKKACIF